MSNEKQTNKILNLELANTGSKQRNTELQEDTCLKCNICQDEFPNRTQYEEHIPLNVVIFCNVCKRKFCNRNTFRIHEMQCHKIEGETETNNDNVTSNINKICNSKMTVYINKKINNKVHREGFQLPGITKRKVVLNTDIKSPNLLFKQRKIKSQSLPQNVLTNPRTRLTNKIIKNTFQQKEIKMNKSAEIDTIQIIGDTTITSRNLKPKPTNRKFSIDNIHVSDDVIIKHIPATKPGTKIVDSITKIQSMPVRRTVPTTTTKNGSRIQRSPPNFVKILPKLLLNETEHTKQQTQPTSSTGRNISVGKGIPIQHFLVKSGNKTHPDEIANTGKNFTDVSNQIKVGQSLLRPTQHVPQSTTIKLHKNYEPARFNLFTEDETSPIVGQNVGRNQKVLNKNQKPNYNQINTENNIQAILRRKVLLPESIVSQQTLASTPILNLPINIQNVQVPTAHGNEMTQKNIHVKSGNNPNVLNETPQTVHATEQANLINRIRSVPRSSRFSNQIQPLSKFLPKSKTNQFSGRPVSATNINLNRMIERVFNSDNAVQNIEKSDSNALHILNVLNTSNTVANGSTLHTATSNALPEAQQNLNEKDSNTTDNKNKLDEMLMDENELDQLLKLAEKMKQTAHKTGFEKNPNLVQSGSPPKSNVDIQNQNQILNECTIKNEIKTEPLDEDMENNLLLMHETEDSISRSKDNNCPEKDTATDYFNAPSDVNAVKPKVENIDFNEPKLERLDANENKDLTAQENIVLLITEIDKEKSLLISGKNPLPVSKVNNSVKDVQNITTNSKSATQSAQRDINENFKEKSQKSGHEKSTAGAEIINTLENNDSDISMYEVETLDEDFLESEELLQNDEKSDCDQSVIEISDDSDLPDVDDVEDEVQSSGAHGKKRFYCEECELPFCSYTSKSLHIIAEHKQRFCFCIFCDPAEHDPRKISLVFDSQQKKTAMKYPKQKYVFYCELCQERFDNVLNFTKHQVVCSRKQQSAMKKYAKTYFNKTRDPQKQSSVPIINIYDLECKRLEMKLKCTFCGNKFSTVQSRLRHEAGYCRENVNAVKCFYSCERCNKQFTTTATRDIHMKRYCYDKNQEMKFECSRCDKKFPFDHILEHHFSIRHAHTYYCDYCQRSFSDKHHLTRHILGHMGMKPFKCKFCREKFTRSCKLQLHVRRWHLRRNYSCNICNKEFIFENLLKKHLNQACSEENIKKYPFLCDVCKKRYANKKLIEKHMKNMHVKQFICHICHKVFGQRFKLNTHLETHRKKFFCKICKKSLITKSRFLRHKASHVTFACECGQKFNLRYDYYKHRIYWCAKTAGKKISEIVKNDALLAKINKETSRTVAAKAKRIKRIGKYKRDKVDGDKKKIMKTNIPAQNSSESEDDCCLQKLVAAKAQNRNPDAEFKENHEVKRNIKRILRKRKNNNDLRADVSEKTPRTNKRKKINVNKKRLLT